MAIHTVDGKVFQNDADFEDYLKAEARRLEIKAVLADDVQKRKKLKREANHLNYIVNKLFRRNNNAKDRKIEVR